MGSGSYMSSYHNTLLFLFTQFDFEAYVFELFDKEPEKLSSLQTLSVRKLPPLTDKSTDDEHDRCKFNNNNPSCNKGNHYTLCSNGRFQILLWTDAADYIDRVGS